MPRCKVCGLEKAYLSARKKCFTCGEDAVRANIRQLQAKKGKYYDRWRKALLRSASTDTQDG